MRKLIFIALLLINIGCNAQKKITTVPIVDIVGGKNLIMSDSIKFIAEMEKTYKRRTSERLWQLDGYINYLSSKSNNKDAIAKYLEKASCLFDPDTQVKVKLASEVRYIPIDEFLKLVSKRKLHVSKIDSVRVPKWDYALIKDDTLGVVCSESEMRAYVSLQNFGHEYPLAIIREQTEDGDEWIPLLGDMVVDCQNKK